MADTQAPLVTPSRPPVTVDISTIEAAKENIVPLHSGRSASQLAALSTSSRAGLGVKLDAEHARFQAQIAAVDVYEQTGAWEDGRDGLSAEDVAVLAEDPLDVSHQYVRFIVANYPAGASAANKLVPVLEATTRKFLADGRYTNDPRYFRLWAHYAKNMEDPEDCYRFLFAKGVAEKLAALYEEYAKVLEAKHKRKQADQVYNLGINRRATPLDRLKRSYLDFQARMLVAPPVPSPPRTAPTADARSILSRAPGGAAPVTGGTGVRPAGNGGLFAVFRDGAGASEAGKEAGWEDFGTVKSRTRENNEEKKEWAGEVMPQKGAAAAPKPGGFKLEVYRDETAAAASSSAHLLSEPDVFSRSSRAPSEADLLRSNPFKNYAASDAALLARDPLEGLEVLPRASAAGGAPKEKSRSGSREGERTKERTVKKASSSSASSSKTKSSSSSSSKTASSSSADPAAKPKERVAVNLSAIYPNDTDEFSFEELKARKRVEETRSWGGWKWAEKWEEECERTGRTSYAIDGATGCPVLFDQASGAPLYDFLPRPAPPTPVAAPVEPAAPSPVPAPASPSPASPTRPSSQPQHSLLSPSPPRSSQPPLDLLARSPPAAARSSSPPPLDPNRPPSPTMNTRAANALLDHLFAKTLDFTKINAGARAEADSSDDSDDDDSDSDDGAAFGGVGVGSESQFSTQGATQQSDADVSDAPFAPFSQTRSQMGDDSAFYGSQRPAAGSQQPPRMDALVEGDENDENAAAPAPLQLFRDAGAVPATPSAGGFRPVTRVSSARAPLGMKAGTPLAAPPKAPLFSVFQDGGAAPTAGVFGGEGEVIPSSQESDATPLGALVEEDDSFAEQEEFEAPLRGSHDSDEDDEGFPRGPNDGYDLGRRVPGQPSRYAPYVQQMTPIVERTLEFTNATSLSASQRSRRDSYYPGGGAGGTVAEEDEDDEPSTEEEDDDEEDGDRAFVASFQQPSFGLQQAPLVAPTPLEDDTSDSSSDSSDDDDEPAPPMLQEPVFVPPSAPVQPARSSLGQDGSYDASLNTSLPEGFTIAGNQSGMTTNMLVDATSSRRSSGSPADAPAPVDPYSGPVLSSLLRAANPPLLEHPDVQDLRHETANRLEGLQKAAKRREKTGKGAKDRTGTIDEAWDVELGGETFSVREKLGEGSYGAVFRVALGGGADEDDFDVDAEEELSLAVKVENPANLWEFHILSQLHARLPERARASVVAAQRLYAYRDESFLFLDYCDQGSLLDAVNRANDSGVAASATGSVGQGLDELLAMFFVVELLRTLEGFHAAGFVHGDLKIDNCLLRLEDVPGGARAWASTYDATGANGWAHKGLKLIDFGRTVDMTAFPPGQAFATNQDSDRFDCAEMREGRPWTFEPDYYGAASVAYNLLFGRYIETKRVPVDDAHAEGPQKWALAHTWRRYYQVDLWTRLFDMLLNPRSVRTDASLPITDEVAGVRREMEEFLAANGEKAGKNLRGLIKKLEIYSMSR
ncbi:protein kinase [Rhodotorula kratochvilovae]